MRRVGLSVGDPAESRGALTTVRTRGSGNLFGPAHVPLRMDPLRGVRGARSATFDPRPLPRRRRRPYLGPVTEFAPDDQAAPAPCDGEAHDWQIVEGDGYHGRAVARCCGAQAVLRFGHWSLAADADDAPA